MTRAATLLTLLLLAGCASWRPAPTSLPFPGLPPDNPASEFFMLEGGEGQKAVCTDLPGALALREFFVGLAKYRDKVNAFEHAWKRLEGK